MSQKPHEILFSVYFILVDFFVHKYFYYSNLIIRKRQITRLGELVFL